MQRAAHAWRLHDLDSTTGLDSLDLTNAEPLFGMYDPDGHPDPDHGVFGLNTTYQIAKIAQIILQPGQGIRLVVGGSGGWGDPLARDAAKVLVDVEDGVYSPASPSAATVS